MILEKAIAKLQHNNSSNTQNYPPLDGFRGLAILFVVLGHYWSIACERLPVLAPVVFWEVDLTNVFMLAGHGVQMFFVMSAFLLYLPFVRVPLETSAVPSNPEVLLAKISQDLSCISNLHVIGSGPHRALGTGFRTLNSQASLSLVANLVFVQPIAVFMSDGSVAPNLLGWNLVPGRGSSFYILLPVFALLAKRFSVFCILSLLMLSMSVAYRMNIYPLVDSLHLSWQQKSIALLNIFPYLDAFTLGMLGARLYSYLTRLAKPVPKVVQLMLVYLPFVGLIYVVSHPFKAVPLGSLAPAFLTDSTFFFNLSSALLIPGMLISKSYISRLISLPILRFTGVVSYSIFLTTYHLPGLSLLPFWISFGFISTSIDWSRLLL